MLFFKTHITIVLLFGLLCFSSNIRAQDSLQNKKLKEITISEQKKEALPNTIQKLDTTILEAYKTTNLQKLLEMHSNVFVKNYGISSLSTISIRGSSAAQTTVQWHGININNVATGISDLSLIPSGLFEQIQIQYGQDGDATNIGGSIQLTNEKPIFKNTKQSTISVGMESLLNAGVLFSFKKSTSNYSSNTKVFLLHANNSFEYFNDEQNQTIKLEHAQNEQIGFTNDFHYKLSPKHLLSFYSMLQHSSREIPATTFELISTKQEHSLSIRGLVKSEYKPNYKWKITSTLAALLDNYKYQDSMIQLQTNTQSITVPFQCIANFEVKKNHILQMQTNVNFSQLLNKQSNQLLKANIGIQYSIKRIAKHGRLDFHLQQEASNLFKVPLASKIILSYKAHKLANMYVSVSQQIRVPTLNELYFQPGGNLLLKPEQSRNAEGGISSSYQQSNIQFESNLNVYTRRVFNWIAWFGNAILTPHNIQMVNSKGLDLMFHAKYNLNPKSKVKDVNIGFFYAYTISTTFKSDLTNDYSIGKQIPYVPRYQAKAKFGVNLKKFSLDIWQTYTGYRFVTTDESQYLKPYFTSNLFTAFLISKRYNMKGNFKLNNLFNQQYESVIGRIMPKRNVTFGIQCSL